MAKDKKQPAKPKRPDWPAIHRDYRTGKFTFRELEEKHGVGYASINRKAKAEGWEKDLTQVVREATKAAVIREAVAQQTATEGATSGATPQQRASDPDVVAVKAAVELNRQVLLRHRGDIREMRDLTMDMLGELRSVGENADKLEIIFESFTSDMKPEELLNATRAYQNLVKLPGRISSMHKLADIAAKLQPLERKAFDLDDRDAGDEPVSESANPNEIARRVAFLLQQGLRAQKGTP